MDAEGASPFEGAELVDWRALPPGQRRRWWERAWRSALELAERYRLALRSGWWEDPIQVEALAAFHCWLALYDTGTETDPTGKLQLLWELERLRGVLRAGECAFDPVRDRPAFERFLSSLDNRRREPEDDGRHPQRDELATELAAVSERLVELRERSDTVRAELDANRHGDPQADHIRRELAELQDAAQQLGARERTLRGELGGSGERPR